MVKYHNNDATTDKGMKKYYLVITYTSKNNEEKYIAFWGTIFEYNKFLDLQNKQLDNQKSNSYNL